MNECGGPPETDTGADQMPKVCAQTSIIGKWWRLYINTNNIFSSGMLTNLWSVTLLHFSDKFHYFTNKLYCML